jgi:hypothetical protein
MMMMIPIKPVRILPWHRARFQCRKTKPGKQCTTDPWWRNILLVHWRAFVHATQSRQIQSHPEQVYHIIKYTRDTLRVLWADWVFFWGGGNPLGRTWDWWEKRNWEPQLGTGWRSGNYWSPGSDCIVATAATRGSDQR